MRRFKIKREIRGATRHLLNLSCGKSCYEKMAVYYDCYRDLGNIINKMQKKGIPPNFLWAWNSLNILATRYCRKSQQEERRGDFILRKFK